MQMAVSSSKSEYKKAQESFYNLLGNLYRLLPDDIISMLLNSVERYADEAWSIGYEAGRAYERSQL